MDYEIEIKRLRSNLIFQWEWSVHEPGSKYISLKNDHRTSPFWPGHWGFGEALTRKRAVKKAKGWIKAYESDLKKYKEELERFVYKTDFVKE